MAGYLNKVQVIGNLGRDPEIRYSGDNRAIANITLATSESWKDKSGERQDRTEWHRIVVFGPLAEVAEKYLKKGDSAYFEGKLQTRKWTGNDGVEKYTTEIVVDQRGVMQMLSPKGGAAEASDSYYQDDAGTDKASAAAVSTNPVSDSEAFDDDIPF